VCICILIYIIQSGLYFLFFRLLLFLMFDKISYACWISMNFSWAACFRVGSFVLSGWNSRDRALHLVVISCWDAPLERPSTYQHIRWIIKLQSSHSNVCHTRNPPTHISSKYITLGTSVAEDSLSHSTYALAQSCYVPTRKPIQIVPFSCQYHIWGCVKSNLPLLQAIVTYLISILFSMRVRQINKLFPYFIPAVVLSIIPGII